MPEYVRVKDKSTGHHYTVLAQEADNHPDAYDVLKQPAVDANGDPLPGEIPATKGRANSEPRGKARDADAGDGYSSRSKKDLEAEIDGRNADRVDDDLVVVEGKGNKPDLIAALEADDQAQADKA